MVLVVVLYAGIRDVLDALHPLCDFIELVFDRIRVVDWTLKPLQLFAAFFNLRVVMLSINFVHGPSQGFHLVNALFYFREVMSSLDMEHRPLQVSQCLDSC